MTPDGSARCRSGPGRTADHEESVLNSGEAEGRGVASEFQFHMFRGLGFFFQAFYRDERKAGVWESKLVSLM